MAIKLYGVDDTDLEQKLWVWRNENSSFRITKRHPIERLPLDMSPVRPGTKLLAKNTVSVLVEYEAA
jgi:hypothetical protein